MKTIDIGKGVTISTPVLTAEEAAVYLGVSAKTLKAYQVPRHRVGGRLLYDVRELDEWIKRQGDGKKGR